MCIQTKPATGAVDVMEYVWFLAYVHCAMCIQTKPATVAVDVTEYVWFLAYVHTNQACHWCSGCNGICLVSGPDIMYTGMYCT